MRAVASFLKESVKSKRFLSDEGRTGHGLRTRLFLIVLDVWLMLAAEGDAAEVVVAAGSCDRSFQSRLLPTHSFASRLPRDPRAAPPRSGGCISVLCEFLAERVTPFNYLVLVGRSRRIDDASRVDPNRRDLVPPTGGPDRTTVSESR